MTPHGPDISSLLAMTLPFPPGLHISVNILHGFVFDPSWIFWDFEISAPSWRTIGGPHGFLEDNWWPPWILRGQLVTPLIPPSYDLTFPSWLAHLSEYPSWFHIDPSWIFWDFEISAPSWRTIGGPHGFLEDNWWPPWILRGQLVTPMDSGRTIGDPPWARYIIPPSYDLTFPSWLARLSEYPSWFRIRSFLDILGL